MKKSLSLLLLLLSLSFKGSAYLYYSEFRLLVQSGNDYLFGIRSFFTEGAPGACSKFKGAEILIAHDTAYINVYYDSRGPAPSLGCSRIDSVNFNSPFGDSIQYITISTNEIGPKPIGHDPDTAWKLFDSTFLVGKAGIKELNDKEKLILYPNPAHQYISIQNTDWQTLVVYNTLGQMVQRAEKQFLQKEQLEIQNLPCGHYFLELFDRQKNKIGVARFYKQTD